MALKESRGFDGVVRRLHGWSSQKGMSWLVADWLSIKTEYVTTNCDLPTLSKKHGVSYSTIRKRSSKEHWSEQREEHRNNLGTLTAQKPLRK